MARSAAFVVGSEIEQQRGALHDLPSGGGVDGEDRLGSTLTQSSAGLVCVTTAARRRQSRAGASARAAPAITPARGRSVGWRAATQSLLLGHKRFGGSVAVDGIAGFQPEQLHDGGMDIDLVDARELVAPDNSCAPGKEDPVHLDHVGA